MLDKYTVNISNYYKYKIFINSDVLIIK